MTRFGLCGLLNFNDQGAIQVSLVGVVVSEKASDARFLSKSDTAGRTYRYADESDLAIDFIGQRYR